MRQIKKIIATLLVFVIHCYRWVLSPLVGQCCRFYPSCSEFAITAIENRGIIRGIFLTIKRLSCCHPWHPGGYDPVPSKREK